MFPAIAGSGHMLGAPATAQAQALSRHPQEQGLFGNGESFFFVSNRSDVTAAKGTGPSVYIVLLAMRAAQGGFAGMK